MENVAEREVIAVLRNFSKLLEHSRKFSKILENSDFDL
jgi:hypothetical protein